MFLSAYVMSNGLFWKRSLHAIMSKTEESRQISETRLASDLQTWYYFLSVLFIVPTYKMSNLLEIGP